MITTQLYYCFVCCCYCYYFFIRSTSCIFYIVVIVVAAAKICTVEGRIVRGQTSEAYLRARVLLRSYVLRVVLSRNFDRSHSAAGSTNEVKLKK
jgi:hypothetical protein